MHAGGYDVVSASGDATLRLIAAGDVEPVNTDLVPDYADMSPFLKETDFNSVDGQMYGIPHGWGANLLMYNNDVVKPAPTTGPPSSTAPDYTGKVTAYDNPIYIADAALYLMDTQPDLGITNPYALDQDQLDAAVDVLKDQNESRRGVLDRLPEGVAGVQDRLVGHRDDLGVHREHLRPEAPETVFPDERLHRLVRHLDDRGGHRPRELRVYVAQLDGDPGDAGRGRRSTSVRLRPTRRRATSRPRASATSTTRPTPPTRTRSGSGPRRSRSASTAAPTSSAPTTRTGPTPGPRSRASRHSLTTASTDAGAEAAAVHRAAADLGLPASSHRHPGQPGWWRRRCCGSV